MTLRNLLKRHHTPSRREREAAEAYNLFVQRRAIRDGVRARHRLHWTRESPRRSYAALKSVEGTWGTPEGF